MTDEIITDQNITEGRLQANCYKWFWNAYPHLRRLLYHVPNGGHRHYKEAAQLKAKGVLPGVPDLVFHYKGRTYFFELKEPGGKGVVSSDQTKVHEALALHNFEVWLVESEAYFRQLIDEILHREPGYEVEGVPTKEEYFYRHSVFTYLYSLEACRVVTIAHVCEESNLEKFVKQIEDFIELGFGHAEGFEILFTPDYLAFYKKDLHSDKIVLYNGKPTI